METVDISGVREKIVSKGWTPGKKDMMPLAAVWSDLTDKEQDSAKSALAKVDLQACQKLIRSWDEWKPAFQADIARSVGRAILAIRSGDHLEWLLDRVQNHNVSRVRKGFIQAIGGALQAGLESRRLEFVEALLALSMRGDAEPAETKALSEALSKSGDPRAAAALKGLDQEVVSAKAQLILNRDLARSAESDDVKTDLRTIIEGSKRALAFWFVPGLEALAKKQLVYAGAESVAEGVLLLDKASNRAALTDNRLWKECGVVIATLPADHTAKETAEAVVRAADELRAWTNGLLAAQPLRLRYLDGSRSQVWEFAQELGRQSSKILCDGRESHWELRCVKHDSKTIWIAVPKRTEDERWAWRRGAVDASSQSTIAAALVTFARLKAGDMVWDPFCGAGTEVLEAHVQFKGNLKLFGTDIEPDAIAIAKDSQKTLKSTALFEMKDALTVLGRFDAIVTNPPFGMRTVRGGARELMEAFFARVKNNLKPGGSITILSHAPASMTAWGRQSGFKLVDVVSIKLGAMSCELQRWQ